MLKRFIKVLFVLAIVLVFFSINEVRAENENVTITFKDNNFFNNIRYSYEMVSVDENTMSLTMKKSVIDSIDTLMMNSKGISDITGIEKMTNLKEVYFENNSI